MGTAEGQRHVRDADLLYRRLLLHGWSDQTNGHPPDLRYITIPGAEHNEDAWADRFGDVLQFLFPPTN
jgi:hypothetical protein